MSILQITNHTNCKNCGHYSHCGQPSVERKHQSLFQRTEPNQYKACDAIAVVKNVLVPKHFITMLLPTRKRTAMVKKSVSGLLETSKRS